ncbi:MAG: non-heme iron oxygenase ferredoxin subunit [Anaerolineae bacterium]
MKVARVEDVPENGRLHHDFDYETVVIFNIGGTFYCIADLCTHDDGPLEDGELEGFEVECPRHGARFDVRTGKALCLPAVTAVPRFEVKVEDGFIWVVEPN